MAHILRNSYYKPVTHFKYSNMGYPLIPLLQQKQQPHYQHNTVHELGGAVIVEPSSTRGRL